jgi:mannose-6-phosphate isomerase-like protein (cupin superfamily)
MSDYTKVNLREDPKDMAVEYGLSPNLESRFARTNLEMEKGGVSYFKIAPDFRAPFGHTHSEQEEVYVVVSGSLRMKVADDIVELGQFDALRVAPGVWRAGEGGPEGAEYIAFGAPRPEGNDAEMEQGWWSD